MAGLAVCLMLAGGPARADDPAPSLFGRVSAVAGAVQYHSSGGEWAEALVNEPVAAGVGLRSARDATAELRAAGIHVALAAASELHVLRLNRDILQIGVPQGRIGVHLDAAGAAQTVEIDLPHGAVWLAEPGNYEIDAGAAGEPPRIEVFSGKALFGGGLDERNLAAATVDSLSDGWRPHDPAAADSHLSTAIPGAAALAAAGSWEHDWTYGAVWYPKDLAADWAPYRDGVWRFLAPWGWTWIDAAPWGFAPSHYGRWARIDDRWGWVPGPRGDDPDFNPAQVAFLGTPSIGLSCPGDTGPAVAWFALAPGETIGDGNDENYKNRRFASAVSRAVFVTGKPVAPALVDLPEQRFADAPVIVGPLGIVPAMPGATAAAARKPAVIAAAKTPEAEAAWRMPFLVHLREALVPPGRIETRRRVTLTAAVPAARPHPAPSTSARNSTHNRQHLAAGRGRAS